MWVPCGVIPPGSPGSPHTGRGRVGPQCFPFRRNLGTNVLRQVPQNGGLSYDFYSVFRLTSGKTRKSESTLADLCKCIG